MMSAFAISVSSFLYYPIILQIYKFNVFIMFGFVVQVGTVDTLATDILQEHFPAMFEVIY